MTEAKVMKEETRGAKTQYKEEYCTQVIEMMSEGQSKAEVCLNLDCCFQTFLNWQRENPLFLESVKKGVHLSKGKWEQMGRKAAFGDVENFNATAWIFNMKNRFGKNDDFNEKWTDKQEVEHSGEVTTFNMNYGAKPTDADD